MNKKVIGLITLMVMVLGILVTPAIQAAEELEVWVPSGPEEDWMKDMAEKYEAKTGTKVEVGIVEELDQPERLSLDGPSGKGADVVGWPHDKLGKTIQQGLIVPIEDYIADGYASNNFVDHSIEALTIDGKTYGLPYAYQTTALLYNKDKYNEIPETMMGLMKEAKSMTNESNDEYGLLFDVGNFYHTGGIFYGYGAYTFKKQADGSYDTSDVGFGTDGAVKAATFIKRFRDMGIIPKGTTGETAEGLFMEGKNAAVITGPWTLADFLDSQELSEDNLGVSPLPKLPNGNYPQQFTGVKGYYISNFSEQKDDAADFIKFLTDAKGSRSHYETNRIIAPNKELVTSSEFKNDELLYPFFEQAKRGALMPSVPEMAAFWDPANNAMTFVLDGKATPEQVMPMTVNQIKQNVRMMNR
jgi:arabinogalactan oligomer/maltooligosaccharide transport system substrate-binding protein